MKRNEAISVALAWFGLIAAALSGAIWGGEADKTPDGHLRDYHVGVYVPAVNDPRGTPIGQPILPAAGPALVEKALRAMNGAEEIVFAVHALYEDGHYYANFGHWSLDPNKMMYCPGGTRLCKLNLRTQRLTVLLEDREGSVRDPRVHYDGGKILFSYRKGGAKHYHLYEINTDGTNLKELTSGPWDDIEPAYLPDGGIIFSSSRCKRFVACWFTPVAVLHRMDADGSNLRILTSSLLHENTPAVLPDGRVMYTRWEYVDRSVLRFHGLWTMNPDGTNQTILFGNQQPPGRWVVMIDAMPIPGTSNVAAIFSPHHGNREHSGNVMIVDPKAGPNDPRRARQISPLVQMENGWMGGRDGFRDPYPLSEDCFLVARDKSLLILDAQGATQEVYRAEEMLHDPRVIRRRPREPVMPPRSDLRETTGRLVLADIYHGRDMQGVKPGTIKKLLVLEQLVKPISFGGAQQGISMNGAYTIKRVLGTVPVEPDGSAYLEVPALRSLYFASLDEQGTAVKRMRSYLTVMPGETLGCVGCHEKRTDTARLNRQGIPLAMSRPPSRPEPFSSLPDVIDYPRDIQPILDKHCVKCHSSEKPEGRVVLTGDHNEWFSQSYYALFSSKQVSDTWGYDDMGCDRTGSYPPYSLGSPASALMKNIDGSHYDAKPSAQEQRLVQLWIDTGALYSGTYAVLNTGIVAVPDKTVRPVVQRRCMTCHNATLPLGPGIHKTQPERHVPAHCLNLYNLTRPEKSMILMAPLAKEAGGYEWCKTRSGDGQPARVFRDTQDPDYQAILQAIRAAKAQLEKIKRFDMPGFRPNEHYVREMKRYGVLPADFDLANDPINAYEVDRAYWRSLWHQPVAP
jgi:hypothetical protein